MFLSQHASLSLRFPGVPHDGVLEIVWSSLTCLPACLPACLLACWRCEAPMARNSLAVWPLPGVETAFPHSGSSSTPQEHLCQTIPFLKAAGIAAHSPCGPLLSRGGLCTRQGLLEVFSSQKPAFGLAPGVGAQAASMRIPSLSHARTTLL